MKKLGLFAAIGLVMTTGSLSVQAQNSVVSAGSSCLNIRSKANSRSAVKFCAPSGTQVKVLRAANSKYSYVEVNGKRGYVFNRYLKTAPRSTASSNSTSDTSSGSSSPAYTAPSTSTSIRSGSQNGGLAETGTGFLTPPIQTASLGDSAFAEMAPYEQNLTGLSQSFRESISPTGQGFPTQPITAPAPSRSDSSPVAQAPAGNSVSANGNDLGSLSWDITRALETEIGKNRGYTLTGKVGWAKLQEDGSIVVNRSTMHCTSATHAHFLKMIGELSKKGLIKLNSESIKALNSNLFRDAWNSNGYANGKLMEMLGGQNFKEIGQARKGDFMKMDRANGSGHTVIYSHTEGGKVCYWSANKRTRGLGIQCESISGKTFTFSRITDLQGLQAGLDNLGNDLNSERSLADVRRRGGNGFVKRNALEFTQVASAPAPLNGNNAVASVDSASARLQLAIALSGHK